MTSRFSAALDNWLVERMAGVSAQRMRYMLLAFLTALAGAFSMHFKNVYVPLAAEVSASRANVERLQTQLRDFETIIGAAEERRSVALHERDELRGEADRDVGHMSDLSASMPNVQGLYALYENLFDTARKAGLEPVSLRRTDPVEAAEGTGVRGADVERVLAGFRGEPKAMFELLGGVAASPLPILLHGVSLSHESEDMVMRLDMSFLVSDSTVGTAQPAGFVLAQATPVAAFGEVTMAAKSVVPPLELQATLFGPQGKIAVIDGEMVSELGAVGDATVLEIMEGRALLERAGVRFLLEVGHTGTGDKL